MRTYDVSMNKLILNRVAIWQPKYIDDLTTRVSPPGRTHMENNIAKVADKPIYRYAKNYKVGKGKSAIKFCLFIMTFSDASKKVETFLNGVAKTVDLEYAHKIVMESSIEQFEYLDEYYGEEK
jgi:hypothetical protein